MWIGKRAALSDEKTRQAEQRSKILAFKKFFGSPEGQAVMLDLMNRFYVLNPLPTPTKEAPVDEFERGRAEGKRDAVLYMLGLAQTDMAQFDKILRGDFT